MFSLRLIRATYPVVTATLAPVVSYVSVSFVKTCINTDKRNTEYGPWTKPTYNNYDTTRTILQYHDKIMIPYDAISGYTIQDKTLCHY